MIGAAVTDLFSSNHYGWGPYNHPVPPAHVQQWNQNHPHDQKAMVKPELNKHTEVNANKAAAFKDKAATSKAVTPRSNIQKNRPVPQHQIERAGPRAGGGHFGGGEYRGRR